MRWIRNAFRISMVTIRSGNWEKDKRKLASLWSKFENIADCSMWDLNEIEWVMIRVEVLATQNVYDIGTEPDWAMIGTIISGNIERHRNSEIVR